MSALLEAISAELASIEAAHWGNLVKLAARLDVLGQAQSQPIRIQENGGQILGPLPDTVQLREPATPLLPARPRHPDEDVDGVIDLLEAVWHRHLPTEKLNLVVDPMAEVAHAHSFWSPSKQCRVIRIAPSTDTHKTLMVALHEVGHHASGHIPRHDRDMGHVERAASILEASRDWQADVAKMDAAAIEAHRKETAEHERQADAWADTEYARLMAA